jgi:ligand-binding sensor domain-containing protein
VNKVKTIRGVLLASLFIFLSGVQARALDPNQPASSFLVTHFTPDDGLPGPVVDQIVQTKDGFLWLITNGNNLSRFDGKNFYNLLKPRPVTMTLSPDGDLWLGTVEDLMHMPSANFSKFTLSGLNSYHPVPGKASRINCLRFSSSGVLWVGTDDGLFRYDRDQFVAVGPRVSTQR